MYVETCWSEQVLLLQSLAPWSAALLAWALLHEPLDRHTGATMVFATAGVAIMGTDWGKADAIGLGAAITVALLLGSYAVVIRASHPRHKDAAPGAALPPALAVGVVALGQTGAINAAIPPAGPRPPGGAIEAAEGALVLAVCTALSGLIFSPVACAASAPHTVIVATKDALLGISAGGFCLGVGLPLYSAAGEHVPAARTNILLLSEVLLAPTWTWLVAGEEYGVRTLLGGSLLLVALVWLALHPSDGDDDSEQWVSRELPQQEKQPEATQQQQVQQVQQVQQQQQQQQQQY